MRKPEFDNLLSVLNRRTPKRPTLFEFIIDEELFLTSFAGTAAPQDDEHSRFVAWTIRGYRAAGYDFVPLPYRRFGGLSFPRGDSETKHTRSLNEGFVITDRPSFESYGWPDADKGDYQAVEDMGAALPEGMKFIVWGPSGVLENVIDLVGYENLCLLTMTDEGLCRDVFNAVGSRLTRFYELCAGIPSVGACIGNDDWGFKNQTMLSPEALRTYVFPWHKRIVEAVHKAGKPAILHSCGNLEAVMDDVIDDIGYDAKHSYEDTVCPVEEAYERWGHRIAVLGGIDIDFLARRDPRDVFERSSAMLDRAAVRGGYALGSGNSIPKFIPIENYRAMIGAATGLWRAAPANASTVA
jgi:uroporphyrinogen decarboxylase